MWSTELHWPIRKFRSAASSRKRLLQTNGNGDVRHVLAAIYGTAVAKKMLPLDVRSLDFEVKGYIALARSDKRIAKLHVFCRKWQIL